MASPLAGLGSSMDINSLITGLMTVERVPLDNLTSRTQQYQTQLSAFGTVKSSLSGLQSAATALAAQAGNRPAAATSSDATVVVAAAQAGASKSSHSLEVRSLAQAQKLYTGAFASADADVGSGTLTITLGRSDGQGFTASGDPLTVTIPAGQGSLTGVRDAINAAGAGVSAAIVNDGSRYRLVITSERSGADYGMRISVSDADGDHSDGDGLSALAYDPVAGGTQSLQVAMAAQDADFTFDGLRMTRSENTLSDVVDNVTFTLNKSGSAVVSIAPDTAAARGALDTLVKSYNSAVSTLKNLTAYDPATNTGSALLGESSIRSLQSQMRSIINGLYGNEGDVRRTLSASGVSLQSDGTLTVDATRYGNAVTTAPAEVERVMTGAARAMADMLDKALATDGLLAARTSGIQTTIRQLGDQKTRMEERLTAIEARYRTQFTALDSLVSSMTATNDYLSTQFETMRNLYNNK